MKKVLVQNSSTHTLLVKLLHDLRKQIAKQKKVPPWVIFQDPSLNDIGTAYPITMEEMGNITGVSGGKALKYAKPFLELIKEYVEENQIDRPSDFVVKQVADKSKVKVSIIQSVDRKIPFEDIAYTNGLTMEELLQEMDMIVSSGTKLDISYYLEDHVDESIVEEICDYLMEAESDSADDAYRNLKDDDVKYEEIRLVRLKFSEVAN
jgi:ATP-dependent DNA helicase RecQ